MEGKEKAGGEHQVMDSTEQDLRIKEANLRAKEPTHEGACLRVRVTGLSTATRGSSSSIILFFLSQSVMHLKESVPFASRLALHDSAIASA